MRGMSTEPHPPLTDVQAFLLAGGMGTRLRSVESRPKAIVPLHGVPFVGFTLRLLRLQGVTSMHLCLGVEADAVLAALRALYATADLERLGITWTIEPEPLGTGGALRYAADHARELNLILNADSYVEAIYEDLLVRHRALFSGTEGALTLQAALQENRADYGGLTLEASGRAAQFLEKGVATAGWINGGVYLTDRAFFAALPEGASSLERDVLPGLAKAGKVAAVARQVFFRDIGTPDRLRLARSEFQRIARRMEETGFGLWPEWQGAAR